MDVKIALHGDRAGKLRSSNCFVNCDKEKLEKDITAWFGIMSLKKILIISGWLKMELEFLILLD